MGDVFDCIDLELKSVGLKNTDIPNSLVLVNGYPVIFKGTNEELRYDDFITSLLRNDSQSIYQLDLVDPYAIQRVTDLFFFQGQLCLTTVRHDDPKFR